MGFIIFGGNIQICLLSGNKRLFFVGVNSLQPMSHNFIIRHVVEFVNCLLDTKDFDDEQFGREIGLVRQVTGCHFCFNFDSSFDDPVQESTSGEDNLQSSLVFNQARKSHKFSDDYYL